MYWVTMAMVLSNNNNQASKVMLGTVQDSEFVVLVQGTGCFMMNEKKLELKYMVCSLEEVLTFRDYASKNLMY